MLVAQITDIHLGFDPDNPAEFNRKRLRFGDRVANHVALGHTAELRKAFPFTRCARIGVEREVGGQCVGDHRRIIVDRCHLNRGYGVTKVGVAGTDRINE